MALPLKMMFTKKQWQVLETFRLDIIIFVVIALPLLSLASLALLLGQLKFHCFMFGCFCYNYSDSDSLEYQHNTNLNSQVIVFLNALLLFLHSARDLPILLFQILCK